jgi:DNA-binding transcriptional LysR family regulator
VPSINWLLGAGRKGGSPRRADLTINNVYGLMKAVQAGAGLGALPDFMANENNDLVQVLPDLDGPQFDAYFVYPEEMRASKRIAVFREFLLRKVAESKF